MKIAILGFGREGQSVLKFLKKKNSQDEIWILDGNGKLKIPGKLLYHQNDRSGDRVVKGKNYLKNLGNFDLVFRSPGVPYNLSEIRQAVKKGVRFSSSTELFFENAKGKIIGITGTKGKGTTATLLYKILKSCGKDAYLAGNIGRTSIDILPLLNRNSITVLELSSFQLQDLRYSPRIAVVLDIFPDHLDAHKNFQEYVNAKANISRYQKESDAIFFFPENGWSRRIAEVSQGAKISVSPKTPQMFNQSDLKIPGFHNFKNAVMAASVASYLKCPKEKIISVVQKFKGNEHRLELAREINGIRFYNDSASTNPETAATAIRAFSGPKILIAGGKDKNLDYKSLAEALKNSDTKLVVLFGENKKKIRKELVTGNLDQGIKLKLCRNLESAAKLAYQNAKSLVTSYQLPVTILFSPASASFDMFRDYQDRGEKFKKLVAGL